jgi:hypothetical protein
LSQSFVRSLYSKGVKYNKPVDTIISILEESENSFFLPYLKEKKENEPLMSNSTSSSSSLVSTLIDGSLMEDANIKEEQPQLSNHLLDMFMKSSKESIENCDSFLTRLDIHAEASEMGSTEALINWSKLLAYGYEISNSKCGFSLTSSDIKLQKQQKYSHKSSSKKIIDTTTSKGSAKMSSEVDENQNTAGEGETYDERAAITKEVGEEPFSIQQIDENYRDLSRSLYTFLLGIEKGNIDSFLPLAFSLLHGLGLESLLYYHRLLSDDWDIPLPLFENDFYDYQRNSNKLRKVLGKAVVKALHHCNSNLTDKVIGYSTLCSPSSASSSSTVGDLNDIVLGLMYIAALHDHADAYVALAYRYSALTLQFLIFIVFSPAFFSSAFFSSFSVE